MPMTAARRTPLLPAAAVFVLAFAISFLRRGSNLTRPQLWAEDGTLMVPHFMTQGWWPLKGDEGYLEIVPHLISNLALTLTPHAYVPVSTWLTWIFMAAVAVFIALAPTLLKGRFFLALACFLVPTDPEVFGIPLYSFWWAGVLLLVLPFWQTQPTHGLLRAGTLLLAGLSSPLAVVTAPMMVIRAALLRHRTEIALAVLAVLCAGAQVYFVIIDPIIRVRPGLSLEKLGIVLAKFPGWFVWENVLMNVAPAHMIAGAVVLALAAVAAWMLPNRWVGLGLLYLLAGAVAMSISRVDAAVLHPLHGGPRYFFYPYILLAWIFIQGAAAARIVSVRVVCAGVLAAALFNAGASGWSRDHQDIPLARHLASCLHFDAYAMPIHLDGSLARL